jgi:hypothetical protein
MFETPSHAQDRSEIAYLKEQLRQKDLALKNEKRKHGKKVAYHPGVADKDTSFNLNNMIRKLDAVDQNLHYSAVPKLQVNEMLEQSQDVLRGIATLVPYLELNAKLPSHLAPRLTEMTRDIVDTATALAESCSDLGERDQIMKAIAEFEHHTDSLVSYVRTPSLTNNEVVLAKSDCLRSADGLARVITPKSLQRMLKKDGEATDGAAAGSESNISFEITDSEA